MRQAGERPAGLRVRGLIVVLWRSGLRVSEALALTEGDLEPGRGAMLIRRGKGGRRREVGMDDWGWRQLDPWLKLRPRMPGWRSVLRSQRAHGRTAVVGRRGANAVSAPRGEGRCQTSLRSPPATPRPRGRDGARGRAPEHHPAPVGPRGPRDYLCLSTRDRQRRDRRCRPRPSRTSDTSGDCPESVGGYLGLPAGPPESGTHSLDPSNNGVSGPRMRPS